MEPWFYSSTVQIFENRLGKGEIACYKQFLFPQRVFNLL